MPLLNEFQLAFCQATDRYIRLLATAGSGKTMFGSALREDFSPEGDVDIHISFPPEFDHTKAEWRDIIWTFDDAQLTTGYPISDNFKENTISRSRR
jgi:hypothetical protein